MPYNSIITAANAASLIPAEVSNVLLQDIAGSNPILQLAQRLPDMSRSQTDMPVLNALATAYFVNGPSGLKQTTQLAWADRHVNAEEIAAIIPIPQSVFDDANYDIWGQCRPQLVQAFNILIAQAILYGTSIPASWSTNLGGAGICVSTVAGGASPATHIISNAGYADWYESTLGESAALAPGAFMLVEADGYGVSGCLADIAMKGKLRNLRDTDGNPIFKTTTQSPAPFELDGAPLYFPTDGSMVGATSRLVAGDWKQLVWSMRQDMTYKIETSGVINDAAGNIVYNLFQQDMVALRAVMRLGFALPNPINRMGGGAATQFPFATLTD
jgi:hypothetical protein